MTAILILVLAFSATAFATEVKVLGVKGQENQKVNEKKVLTPYVSTLCIDGYVFIQIGATGSQFLVKGPDGKAVPKT